MKPRTVRRLDRAVAPFRWATLACIILVAATTVAAVFDIRTNQPSSTALVVLAVPELLIPLIGPLFLGGWGGVRAVLVTALIATACVFVASLYVERADWGLCVHAQGMDGSSPSPCRGDLREGFSLVPAIWIMATGSFGAWVTRLSARADERAARRRATGAKARL